MNEKRIHVIKILLPLIFSATFLILLFYKVQLRNVFATLTTSRMEFVIPAIILSLSVNILLGAYRWQFILSAMHCHLPFGEILTLRTGCIPFKILMPMKSSELLKGAYLSRHAKLPFIETVSSLLIDKVMNLVVILSILACGLLLTDIPSTFIVPVLPLFFIIPLMFTRRFRQILIRTAGNIHPRLHSFIERLLCAFEGIGGKDQLVILFYSIIYQVSEFVNTWLLFKAVGVSLPIPAILTWIPLIMMINNLPVSILGIGTREAGMLIAFARFGSEAAILGGGLLVTLVEHVFPVMVGLFFMHRLFQYYKAGMQDRGAS